MTKITIDRAIVEQALEALEKEPADFSDWLRTMQAARTALRVALANHSGDATEMDQEIEAAMADQVTHGLGITLGGKRIDPASIYKQAESATCQESRHAEPVAWAGYDLDAMAEAFSRVIEAYHSSKHPFHNPINMDAQTALRILRGFIPAMKASALSKADPVQEPAQQQEPKLPEFYARFEDGLVSVYQRREDATPLLLLRENLPDKQPAQQEQEPDDEPTYCPTCGVEDGGTTCGMPNCGLRCGAEHAEPVAWMDIDSEGNRLSVRQWSDGNSQEVPLYLAPQRKLPSK